MSLGVHWSGIAVEDTRHVTRHPLEPHEECPVCKRGLLRYREACSTEPHGEYHDEAWYECPLCSYKEEA